MKLWHFVGDVFEWLESRPHVSGVQRVALQLLWAGCAEDNAPDQPGPDDGVCTLAGSGRWLAPVSTGQALAFFRPWLRPTGSAGQGRRLAPRSDMLLWPGPDEHVLFAGLVWIPLYAEIFRRLSAFGIRFSVLVHDIIPLQRPDLASPEESARFSEWLGVTLTTADAILVSTQVTRDAIRTWACDRGLVIKGHISVIPFGTSHLASPDPGIGRPKALPADPNGFVLSVGTIDRRKNQTLLLTIWTRLLAELAAGRVPPLVLAGRPNLPGLEALTRGLSASGKLVILDNSTDEQLAWLYRNCLFTVFPSLCEGYGLPVAESLSHGKLCVASSLPEVRELTGDLVWYFNPLDADDAYGKLRLAIVDGTARAKAETRIAASFVPVSWSESLAAIRTAAMRLDDATYCDIRTRG